MTATNGVQFFFFLFFSGVVSVKRIIYNTHRLTELRVMVSLLTVLVDIAT